MTGLKQALKDAGNQIGPETIILTPLNGVESEEVAAAMYGRDQVLYSLMRVSSVKSGNQITFDPEVSYIEFGEQINDPNALSPKVQKVKEFFDLADIPSVIRPDMLRAIWEKYVCNVSENQVSAVLNIPFGAWGACTDADRLRILTAGEVIQIARKKGIPIEENYAEKHLGVSKNFPLATRHPPFKISWPAAKQRWKCSQAPSCAWEKSWIYPHPLMNFSITPYGS